MEVWEVVRYEGREMIERVGLTLGCNAGGAMKRAEAVPHEQWHVKSHKPGILIYRGGGTRLYQARHKTQDAGDDRERHR